MDGTLIVYLRMMRPVNSFMSGIGVVFAYMVYTGYTLKDPSALLIGFITGFLGSASSMLINDYVDRGVDAINKPWKPIPSGKASTKTTVMLSIILMTIGVLINMFIGLEATAVAGVYIVAGYLYSFMRRFWWSHFIVSFSTTGPIIYGYVIAGMPGEKYMLAILFSATIFFITSGREVLKAIMDIDGDKRYGYRTIPICFGIDTAKKAMLVFGSMGSLTGIALGLLGYANTWYLVLISLAAIFYMVNLVEAYRRVEDRGVLEKARRNTLAAMMIGLIAFLLSSI